MNKSALIYTPEKICATGFNGIRKFQIPLYQRLFEWGDEQLAGLLTDMKEHFEKNDESYYYIGMMTAAVKNGVADLVDGQQRFTTMMLLGIAMRGVWENFIQKDRLKFVARDEDQQYLSWLIENYKPETIFNHTADDTLRINRKMERGLEIISNFLSKMAEAERNLLFLSAKPQKSESNFLICRSWACFMFRTSPLVRFPRFQEAVPQLLGA